MKKIRIGQIGIGHNHGEAKMLAVRKFPELFEVVGVSEKDPAWLQKRGVLKGYEGLDFFDDEDELISKCDALLIETDVKFLTKTAQKCISAGKHIHVDKPASGTNEDFARLLAEAKEKGLTVQLGYMYRYNPAIKKAIELAEGGKLGEIYKINAEMSTYHKPSYKEWLSAFNGGIMYILGSHLVDLTVYLLRKPQKIHTFMKHTGLDGVDFPDNTLAVLEYEKALARIYVSSVEVNGWGRRQFVVGGSLGTVAIEPIENETRATYSDLSIADDRYEDRKILLDVQDVPKSDRYDEMMRDFYAYIRKEKQNPFTYEHDLAVHEVLNEICGVN